MNSRLRASTQLLVGLWLFFKFKKKLKFYLDMNLKRRTSTNKTPRICLAFLIVFGIYYIIAHTDQVVSSKSNENLPLKPKGGCANLGCTEFPIHHNVLHKLPVALSKKALEMCDKTFWHTLSTTIKNTDHNDFFVWLHLFSFQKDH